MAANNNVKVGITVTVFSVVLITLLLWLSQFKPQSAVYQLEGNFANVGGLIPGSKVYFLGVTVGTVTATDLAVDKVKVIMDIDSKIKISLYKEATRFLRLFISSKIFSFLIE